MSTNDGGYHEQAVAALAARDYAAAGEAYTRSAWRVLSEPRDGSDPYDADEKGWVGDGLRYLTASAVAFRVGGRPERASRRAVEGIAVARDLKSALDRPVQGACLDEFVADFRVAGDTDGVEAAYQAATGAYERVADTVDDPREWATTPLFTAAAATVKQVARGQSNGEIAVKWEDLHGADPTDTGQFLSHRARYKRQRFPGLVERAVEEGHLAAPRGTTEYDTDVHRCPNCRSTDVNWIADRTLCLRCSTPTERA